VARCQHTATSSTFPVMRTSAVFFFFFVNRCIHWLLDHPLASYRGTLSGHQWAPVGDVGWPIIWEMWQEVLQCLSMWLYTIFLWRVHVAICCQCGANIRLPLPKLLMQMWLPQPKLDRKLASCYNWCKEKLVHGGIEPQSFDPAHCSVERPAKPHISTTHPPPKQDPGECT
jgi:hypothetical protein